MIKMGIDQSLTCTGIVILGSREDSSHQVLHSEAITTSKTDADCNYKDTFTRATTIASRIAFLAESFDVDQITLEGLALGSKGNATRNLAILLGMIVNGLPSLENISIVPPTTLKKYATGNGRADKAAMLQEIHYRDPLFWATLDSMTIKAGKYDIADAYWLAKYNFGEQS